MATIASWSIPADDATSPIVYDPNDDNFLPFGIAIASDDTGWVTNSYNEASSIVQLQLDVAAKSLMLMRWIAVGQTVKESRSIRSITSGSHPVATITCTRSRAMESRSCI